MELHGRRLFLIGRFEGVTRRGLDHLVRRAGGKTSRRLNGVNVVAVAHDMARPLLSGHRAMATLEAVSADADLVSELSLRRRLGLARAPAAEAKTLSGEDLSRLAGLDPDLLLWLTLFDVVEPQDGLFGYRDVVAAREVVRLMRQGFDLADIVHAAITLRRRGIRFSEARLTAGETGELLRQVEEGRLVGLDDQFDLPLEDTGEDIDAVFEAAAEADAQERYEEAERLYWRAYGMDRWDPVIPFNLGNVYEALKRPREALLCWQLALDREPAFVEARFNYAIGLEEAGRDDQAIGEYRVVLAIAPDYADAAYNLGLLLSRLGRHADALPVWEHFLTLEPQGKEALIARRHAGQCRIQVRAKEMGLG